MKIGIIGTGKVAAPLGRMWGQHGHAVYYGSRSPETLGKLLTQSGPRARAGSPQEAIAASEVILEAIPFGMVPHLPLAELQGKVLLSASNYFPQRDGVIDLNGLTQTEWLATQLPGVRLIKTFSMMGAAVLERHANGDKGTKYAIFLAGNEERSKQTAAGLIAETGFDPVDVGPLAQSWMYESLTGPLFDARLTKQETLAEIERLAQTR